MYKLINEPFARVTSGKTNDLFLWGKLTTEPHLRVLVKRKDSIIDENRVRSGLDIRERRSTVKARLKKDTPVDAAATRTKGVLVYATSEFIRD